MSARTETTSIPFVDLQAQRVRLGNRIDEAIRRVLDHGQFIMGPEVDELERRLAEYCDARHAVTCSSGTDALLIAMLALGIGQGDAVVVPTLTFAATAEAVVFTGAIPVFADVLLDTYDLDVASARDALHAAEEAGLRPRAVIAVDLYGQPADYDALEPLCAEHSVKLIVDAAQSFGATWRGRRSGSIGDVACTSFFPAKPLGCYGDGGAIFTDSDEIARLARSIRVHGQGSHKYENMRIGLNGRLDTIQAAVLLEKLAIFDDELGARRRIAGAYSDALRDVVIVPTVRIEAESAWAQYTIQVDNRPDLAARLAASGAPTAVYYPKPLHLQPACRGFPTASGDMSASEHISEHVLSLPMHPYLRADHLDRIVAGVGDGR